MQPLRNARHELFAQNIATGMKAVDAYRALDGKAKRGTSEYEVASKLLRKVESRVRELQAASATKTTLTMQERRELLAKRARSDGVKDSDLVSIVIADARMAGELKDGNGFNVGVGVVVQLQLGDDERAQIMAAKQRSIAAYEAQLRLEGGDGLLRYPATNGTVTASG